VKTYRVGGSVRDELLGRPVTDRDWVVVGATPEALQAAGFKPVGRDFPVFLHPKTREEYALARTERKSGRGYHGFVFHTSPDVTLEQDLERRDLTINAMARAEDGTLVDPFGGAADLEARVLRHVSPAFAEDPLRVLRVARFAARLDFSVAPETEALMRELVASGELATVAAERVWQELARGMMEPRPSRLLAVLRECGALAQLLPEVDALYGVAQPPAHHPEVDAGVHVALALDYAAARGFGLAARYAVLAHDLGKGATPASEWPQHHAHEMRGARLAERMSARLKVPIECRDAARLTARWHLNVARAAELRPATLLDLLTAADALRRPERLDTLLAACEADSMSRPRDRSEPYAPAVVIREALAVVRGVRVAAIAEQAQRKQQRGSDAIATAIRAARIKALRDWRSARRGQDRTDGARAPARRTK
jgi:tRNA nucleotidyltransferase (CCA-adding enzyme)